MKRKCNSLEDSFFRQPPAEKAHFRRRVVRRRRRNAVVVKRPAGPSPSPGLSLSLSQSQSPMPSAKPGTKSPSSPNHSHSWSTPVSRSSNPVASLQVERITRNDQDKVIDPFCGRSDNQVINTSPLIKKPPVVKVTGPRPRRKRLNAVVVKYGQVVASHGVSAETETGTEAKA